MFLKSFSKYNKTTKQRYIVYRLCESYRIDNKVHHKSVVGLGRLDELETDDLKKSLGIRIEELIRNGGKTLSISDFDPKVEELAQHFYHEIKKKQRYDTGISTQEWERINLQTLKSKDAREIGAEWLCKQAFDQLGISGFLSSQGWNDEQISLATTHVISRAVYPASEYKTVSWIKENSAVCEITGYDQSRVTKDRLYSISHKLYGEKAALERYLSKRTNELFDLQDSIILYDLTNTYYE